MTFISQTRHQNKVRGMKVSSETSALKQGEIPQLKQIGIWKNQVEWPKNLHQSISNIEIGIRSLSNLFHTPPSRIMGQHLQSLEIICCVQDISILRYMFFQFSSEYLGFFGNNVSIELESKNESHECITWTLK